MTKYANNMKRLSGICWTRTPLIPRTSQKYWRKLNKFYTHLYQIGWTCTMQLTTIWKVQ